MLILLALVGLLAAGTAYAGNSELPGTTSSGAPLSGESPGAPSSQQSRPGVLTLQDAVDTVLAANPKLAEIRARAEALAAVPSQVGTLPDPKLSFGALNLPTDSFDLDQEPMTQLQIGVRQTVPFPGKLRLRETIATLDAETASLNVDDLTLALVADVKSVWWQLAYLREAAKIVERNQVLMREFVEIASTKYEVGQGLQEDVLLAQLELSKLTDLDLKIHEMSETAYAQLNALLDWPAGRRPVLPENLSAELPELLPEEQLQDLALQNRPMIAAMEKQIEAAESAVDLAKKDYYPDFNFFAAYGFRDGEDTMGDSRPDLASFGVTVDVPIFASRKQSRAVDQRRSEFVQKLAALTNTKARIRRDVSIAVANYRRSRDGASLFRTGIVPQARQTVSSMLAAYQVDEVDFLNLVNAEITLYNYEMQFWKAVADANGALANLEAASGTEKVAHE